VLNVSSSRNVPGGYGGYLRGNVTNYSTYTSSQHLGRPQPPPPPPYQFPVLPTYPIGDHANVIPRVLRPVLPQLGTGHVNYHTRPPPDAFPHVFPQSPDPAQPPPYPYGGFATPGRLGVPETSYQPVPSYGGDPAYEFVSPHASERPRPQVRQPDHHLSPSNDASRNPPAWPSATRTLSSFACHRIISLTRSVSSGETTTTV